MPPTSPLKDRSGIVTDSDKDLWMKLIRWLKTGSLIPIVGPDLLMIEVGGVQVNLYRYIAEQMAVANGLAVEGLPKENPLSKVAIKIGRNRAQTFIDHQLSDLLSKPDFKVPEALIELARIKSINLFVTTTFDPLLERAINEVRFGGEKGANVWRYSLNVEGDVDLPSKEAATGRPNIFHLFGNASDGAKFVITENDTLDFMAALQSRQQGRIPTNLLYRLKQSNLLFLGNRFHDWLARFFVRLTHDEPLKREADTEELFADDRALQDFELRDFFDDFRGNQCQVYLSERAPDPYGSAVKFVKALAAAWEQSQPKEAAGAQAVPPLTEIGLEHGAVFISYDRRAKRSALNAAGCLRAGGVSVWMDKNNVRDSITAGDKWMEKIQAGIEHASVFLPIISKETNKSKGVVFEEWEIAVVEKRRRNPGRKYIVPIIIDEGEKPPNLFSDLDCPYFLNGMLPDALVAELRNLQQQFLRQ